MSVKPDLFEVLILIKLADVSLNPASSIPLLTGQDKRAGPEAGYRANFGIQARISPGAAIPVRKIYSERLSTAYGPLN